MSFIWPLALAAYSLWDYYEAYRRKKFAAAYTAWPLPENPRYLSSDVSVIIPTVDPPATFTNNLGGILQSQPREIIIITTLEFLAAVESLVAPAGEKANEIGVPVAIRVAARANKRDQLIQGINESGGNILALVDDDAFWKEGVLPHLLAPFVQDDVALVGGPITSHVDERQVPDTITPWEVAAIRLRSRRYDSTKAFFVADGGTNFVVSGATMLLRREILTDPVFQNEFLGETWCGVRQNTGDDSFISRWVLFGHLETGGRQWKLGMQLTPEAEISTGILPHKGFISQLKRWYRSGLRLRLQCLWFQPGFRALYRNNPYMTTKMAQGMFTFWIFLFRVLVWWWTGQVLYPWGRITFWAYLIWQTWNYIRSLRAFVNTFPWTRRYLWAAVIVDWVYLISDFYSWFTLSVESWSTRESVDQGATGVNNGVTGNDHSDNTWNTLLYTTLAELSYAISLWYLADVFRYLGEDAQCPQPRMALTPWRWLFYDFAEAGCFVSILARMMRLVYRWIIR
jgi:hypothetical protein